MNDECAYLKCVETILEIGSWWPAKNANWNKNALNKNEKVTVNIVR